MLIFLLTELHFSFLTEASLNHLLLDFVHGVIWDSWKKSAQSHQAPFYLLQASYPSYCVLKISQIIFCNTLSLSTCGQSLSMPSAMFPPFFDIKLHRVFFIISCSHLLWETFIHLSESLRFSDCLKVFFVSLQA